MIVLLDIDGVMVPAASWKSPGLLEDGFACFSARAAQALNHIIAETQASIVLTTSHKSIYSIGQWEALFRRRGIHAAIARLDANTANLSRKDELLRWFDAHEEIDDYVIIDDDKSLNDLPPAIKERLVLTSAMIGLTADQANQAIEILNAQVTC